VRRIHQAALNQIQKRIFPFLLREICVPWVQSVLTDIH